MNQTLFAIISFSIAVPAVLGLWRIKKVDKGYYPFLGLLWVGVFNEVLSYFLIKGGRSNAVPNNVYYLTESFLVLYQFKNWHRFERPKYAYQLLRFTFLVFWVAEVFWWRSPFEFASYFIILYSFVTTLISISLVNALLARERKALLYNPVFLIALGFIVYFTYAVLLEVFYVYGITGSKSFQLAIVTVMAFVNLVTNLLFAIAVLWIPKKQRFSLSY